MNQLKELGTVYRLNVYFRKQPPIEKIHKHHKTVRPYVLFTSDVQRAKKSRMCVSMQGYQ